MSSRKGLTLRTRAFCILAALVGARCLSAQNPEAGVTILSPRERLLRIDSYRPLDSAAHLLASDYQINISAEDPPFACSADVIDTQPGRKNPLAAEHAFLPKGGVVEVRFAVNAARYPLNRRELLDQVVSAYNQKGNFRYRLEQEGDFFSFVPVGGRDARCVPVSFDPLLSQMISVPSQSMGIYRAIAAIESALSKGAGEPVHVNTQEWLNRIPDLPVSFASRSRPARDLLLTVIRTTHYRFYWLAREQPFRRGYTINLVPLTSRIVKGTGGGFSYPWILWPGKLPLPPLR